MIRGKGLARSETFPRTISYPSSFYSHLPACEDGTDRVFRNVGI